MQSVPGSLTRLQGHQCLRCDVQRKRRNRLITAATVAGLGLAVYAGFEKGSWSIQNLALAADKLTVNVAKFSVWLDKRDEDAELLRQLASRLASKNAACPTNGTAAPNSIAFGEAGIAGDTSKSPSNGRKWRPPEYDPSFSRH